MALGVKNGTAELQTQKYRVVNADKSYRGEIQVGVTFTLKVIPTFDDYMIDAWDIYMYTLIIKSTGPVLKFELKKQCTLFCWILCRQKRKMLGKIMAGGSKALFSSILLPL